MATVHTIGHSTRTLDQLISALKAQGIATLVDIRAFPTSRRLPHFNRESLEQVLPTAGVAYVWKKELGGRRRKILQDSPNTGLRVEGFRNYADYMLTPAFAAAISDVLVMAERGPVAIMCAERLFFRCHRMMVSDWLALHGHEVLHIEDESPPRPHRITPEARLVDGCVLYPGLLS